MDNDDWRTAVRVSDDGSLTIWNREIGLQQTFELHDYGPEVIAELNRERDEIDSLERDGWRPFSAAAGDRHGGQVTAVERQHPTPEQVNSKIVSAIVGQGYGPQNDVVNGYSVLFEGRKLGYVWVVHGIKGRYFSFRAAQETREPQDVMQRADEDTARFIKLIRLIQEGVEEQIEVNDTFPETGGNGQSGTQAGMAVSSLTADALFVLRKLYFQWDNLPDFDKIHARNIVRLGLPGVKVDVNKAIANLTSRRGEAAIKKLEHLGMLFNGEYTVK